MIDWPTVVELRRQASAAITEEGAAEATRTGRPVGPDDRLLLGRAVIRRVVGDHVRTLHRDGSDLWSRAQEEQYVEAVENAVFGYGRLQPLLELPDVENIEIAGCDSVVVQYGDGRRERRPPVADTDAELIDAIRFLGQNGEPSRPFDDTHPDDHAGPRGTVPVARHRVRAVVPAQRGDPPAHPDRGVAGRSGGGWADAA